MKNKLLYALMAISMSALLFGCASSTSESNGNKDKYDKPSEIYSEPSTDAPSVDEETEENESESESNEETTDADVTVEEMYLFEGKYWINEDEFKAVGYYFDGLDLTMIVEGETKTIRPYEADSTSINFIDRDAFDEYYWSIQNDALVLENADSFEITTWNQVDESTFEMKFNWVY